MKKILSVFLVAFLLLPEMALANGAGLPAFFKVNGKLSTPNPLQIYGITAQSFLIPQDFTSENYVVDKPIDFEIDKAPLQTVIPEDLISNTKFSWDFGDGNKAEGLKNSHVYKKIGSYILILTINVYTDPAQPPTQFIDSFLLNIMPNKNYNKLPKAIIKINDKQLKSPYDKTQNINFNYPVYLDAGQSVALSSEIVQYLWNFGDGETSSDPVTTHIYKTRQNYDTIVLRVKDKNGFISDAFVGLNNDTSVKPSTSKNPLIQSDQMIAVSVIIVGVILFLYSKRKK